MNNPRDHLAALRWRAANGRTHVRNAWYRAAGRRIQGTRTGWHNWRNGRAIKNGRAPRLDGAIAAATSRTPLVRSRINRATGRPRRDDATMHRGRNESLARMKTDRARWPGSESVPADRARATRTKENPMRQSKNDLEREARSDWQAGRGAKATQAEATRADRAVQAPAGRTPHARARSPR